ncbi:hypothetical protein MG293_001464 [Ovis ammon polii]|uniref:Uncharacterized protein n=1 Tax=Ovis ammon polii TaxID=230172 RepID=A0AAD4UQ60_OVIAM|nr:hypothetical protein MG293_001464 [Ovis ammon polii]
MKVKSLSRVRLFKTPRTAAYQVPPFMGFSRQEYWSGVPSPSLDWETKILQTTQYDQNSFYHFQNSLDNFVDISSYLQLCQVGRGGGEEIPLVQGKEQQLLFAGAAVKRYPTSKKATPNVDAGFSMCNGALQALEERSLFPPVLSLLHSWLDIYRKVSLGKLEVFQKQIEVIRVGIFGRESCPTLRNPMDWNLPGSSVHGSLQARILEWAAVLFSGGSSQPRDRTHISYVF